MTSLLRPILFCALVSAGSTVDVFAAQQAPPPRDAKTEVGTASVRGRVISASTGQPLHRVRVTLGGSLANPPSAVTDTRGEFELTKVPAGTYSITATRAGYLTIQFGQRRPREPGRTIHLDGGDVLERVDIAMSKGGVLAGRVGDEQGDPSPGARVEAIELRYLRGRRIPVAARITTTNDAGEYRLSGLEPGAYQLRASTAEVWEADDGKTTYVHAVTYFPGVSIADQPQSVNVTSGREVSGLDFRLIAGRAARITGVVEDASGAPLPVQVVNLDRITRTIGGALVSAGGAGSAKTDASGAFEFPKLPAGEYMVYSGSQSERTSIPVIMNDGDMKHVVMTPKKPAAVAGSLVTDDGTVPPFPAGRLRILPVAWEVENALPAWGAPRDQSPRPDWTFRVSNMDGQYLFRVLDLPDDWMLKAVLLGGRDLTDTPLAISRGGPDTEGVQLVLSRKGAKIAGEVADRAGAAAPDTTVILFAEDSRLWGVSSRFVRAIRPDSGGRFSTSGLPPGVYRAAVREIVIDGQWEDPEFLQSLLKDAVRVELSEGSLHKIKLTLEPAR